jgi:hypothetical protein
VSSVSKAALAEVRRSRKASEEVAGVALHNEQVTRQRVEALEDQARAVGALLGRGFFGRLRWLFFGR